MFFFLFLLVRLPHDTKITSHISRILSSYCGWSRYWFPTILDCKTWNAFNNNSRCIFPVHVASNHLWCWILHAQPFIFWPSWHYFANGCGGHNFQCLVYWGRTLWMWGKGDHHSNSTVTQKMWHPPVFDIDLFKPHVIFYP